MSVKFNQEHIVNYLKNYGFIFASSEIYGGLANTWDFGPLGVLLKNNIKQLWWDYFVTKDPRAVGLDSSIFMNSNVWKTSQHLTNFADPLIDCKHCHNRFRADKLIENAPVKIDVIVNEQTPFNELEKIINDHKIKCPVCGSFVWTPIRYFNLMFKTNQGIITNDDNVIYLRPETAQGIFINFANIQRTLRLKLPFAVGQIGKAFRNEITPGNFIFRTREFEQMELEYFCDEATADNLYQQQINRVQKFIIDVLHLDQQNVRLVTHTKEQLSHYAQATVDLQYRYLHGWNEMWGIANRGNYDLNAHSQATNANLWYLDPISQQKIIPFVIEPSVSVERLFYALITDKYANESLTNDETREVLHLSYKLAPYKVAVLPLTNKLTDQANIIYQQLLDANISTCFDTSGSIGKRYRRQDAIGTPHCITFDFDSLNNRDVTVRDRDSMKQMRVKIDELINFFNNRAKHD